MCCLTAGVPGENRYCHFGIDQEYLVDMPETAAENGHNQGHRKSNCPPSKPLTLAKKLYRRTEIKNKLELIIGKIYNSTRIQNRNKIVNTENEYSSHFVATD